MRIVLHLDKKEESDKVWDFLKQNFPSATIEIPQENGSLIRPEAVKVVATALANVSSKGRFPTSQELETYILSLPNGYSHTTNKVAKDFLGHEISFAKENLVNPEVHKQYNKLWIMLDKVHRRIAIKQNGRWERQKTSEHKFGVPVQYTFIKN